MKNKNKAIWLMILSAMGFAMMQICISKTADTIPLFEQVFFRNLIAFVVSLFAICKKKLNPLGKKENRLMLNVRSLFGFLGMLCTFYAAGHGEQGDVSVIIKMSPFAVTILAFFFLKEKITKYQVTALFVALIGALFVANPQFNSNLTPIIVAVFACIFMGFAYTLVSALKNREAPEVTICYFSLFSTLMTIPFAIYSLVIPSFGDLIYLILIGLFAAIGQITLTYSYTYAKASEVSIYNYTGIIFSMIFGFMFLGESVKITSIIGAIFVIFAGLIVYYGGKKVENHEKLTK